ncbi:hypothetical protein VNO77_48826 [Canavalia gladiata]|uniref:Uncharacterized protein n=1 Tax=Canavalia gladiata TaxID=3824 RepID=A0AAN9PHE9_CANGL
MSVASWMLDKSHHKAHLLGRVRPRFTTCLYAMKAMMRCLCCVSTGSSTPWQSQNNARDLPSKFRCIWMARPLCHLQYPVAYLSRLQRILPAARWELRFKASRRANSPDKGRQRHVPLGGRGPLLLVGKRTAGARVASSPDSDLEAFSHNPTHGSFAPLAFQPSAMTNCANQRFLSY